MFKTDTTKCNECVYRLRLTAYTVACGYLFYTNKRRPCEPGLDCTEFLPYEGNEDYRSTLLRNTDWLRADYLIRRENYAGDDLTWLDV